MAIEIAGITKRFGTFTALDNVDLTVEQGELLALLGPSGSGKTTLLRIIAGLEFADAGDIRMYGETTQGRPPRDRQVGFVCGLRLSTLCVVPAHDRIRERRFRTAGSPQAGSEIERGDYGAGA
jgi:ABC-type branched-subunit amino acid transport system ATPase component